MKATVCVISARCCNCFVGRCVEEDRQQKELVENGEIGCYVSVLYDFERMKH